MKNLIFKIALICLLSCIWSLSIAQNDNILIDREFWKGNPSLQEVRTKVKEGHSPTVMTAHNFDAIGYAILEKQSLSTIKYLLSQGNDVNKLTHDARTYIFWAAYKGNLELMKHLVKHGAKIDLIDQHGYSILMFAATTGQENQDIYDYLIEVGADMLTEKDRLGRNPLLAYAGSTKNGNLLTYFLEKGLKITSKDSDGNGIFNHAAKTGNRELMERLINAYMVETKKNAETNENAILFASRRRNRSGEETDLSFFQYLEGLGLDPTIVSKKGDNALHNLATRSKKKELFEYFIEKGVSANQLDEEGNTALIKASASRDIEIIKLLTKHTDNINIANTEGISALTQAIRRNALEVAQYLVDNGAKSNILDNKGFDLGYHLIDAYRKDIEEFNTKLSFLVDLGYEPSSTVLDGSTLLHIAINKQDSELIAALIAMNIDVNAKDKNGQTILHHAAMQASDETLLKYLITSGADKNSITEFDETAYDLASANEMLLASETSIEFLKPEMK